MRFWTLIFALALALPATLADVSIANGTLFSPTLSNVTYHATQDFSCTELTVSNYCLNITGGIYAGDYCVTSPVPIALNIGDSFITVYIYDQQQETLLTWRNVSLEIIGDQPNLITDDAGVFLFGNISGDYELKATAVSYYPTNYYLTISGTNNTIVYLYMLNESEGTRVLHTLYDQDSEPAEDITVSILRWYSNSGSFKTVQMAKTNFEGQASLYVQLYDTYYKLKYSAGNITYKITNTTYWFQTETEDNINLNEDFFRSWREFDNGYHTLEWVNSSGTIYARYSFSIDAGLMEEGCLQVQRYTTSNIYDICNNCTTSNTAVLTCKLTNDTGQYKAIGYIETNTENSVYTTIIDWYKKIDYGGIPASQGILMTAILIGTVAMVGFATLTGSIIITLLAVIVSSVIGLAVGITMQVITFWAILGILISVIAWKAMSR